LVADLVYGGDEAVKRCTGVVVGEPEGLAIVWNSPARVMLLLAIVDFA